MPCRRENLAAKVLRENLVAQGRTNIEPECPHMLMARNAALFDDRVAPDDGTPAGLMKPRPVIGTRAATGARFAITEGTKALS